MFVCLFVCLFGVEFVCEVCEVCSCSLFCYAFVHKLGVWHNTAANVTGLSFISLYCVLFFFLFFFF